MSRFWSPAIRHLQPYVPGEQPKRAHLVKLNTNENPYGPSSKVVEAIQSELNEALRLYPDPEGERLKQAAADFYGIEPGQVFVGNGSDEILAHAFFAFFRQQRPILFPDVSYSFYPVYCGLYGIDYQTVALDDDYRIRVDDYARPNGGIIFPNPNAPTGHLLALSDIANVLEQSPDSVVVVDEAYIDFGGESAVALLSRYPNLLVVQTLSKSRSLAGLRVGMAMGHIDLIEGLRRVKDSFNSYPLDRLAIAGAAAAFEDRDHFDQTRHKIMADREELIRELQRLGFNVLPSAANFVFARVPDHEEAGPLADRLREQGVIVRYFNKPRIDRFLRITVGTPEQNRKLIEALERLFE